MNRTTQAETTSLIVLSSSLALGLALLATPAEAQFWDPLESKLKPIMNIALDTSATMDIDYGCNDCHRADARINEVKAEVTSTMDMFRDLFVYGGYTYRGCGVAHIYRRRPPNLADIDQSYTDVVDLINGANACRSSERGLPPGMNCITAWCADEVSMIDTLATNPFPGLNPPAPPAAPVLCDSGALAGSTIDFRASVIAAFGSVTWPRWNGTPSNSEVTNELCAPVIAALAAVNGQLATCLVDPTPVWPLDAWLNGTPCNAAAIAPTICASGATLEGSCVCDQGQDGCNVSNGNSECGVPLEYRARQQVAMCEAYSPVPGRIGRAIRDDPNNVANGGYNPSAGRCRENALIMLTDSYPGSTTGLTTESATARSFYSSANPGEFNMFLFHVSPIWGPSYSPDLATPMAAALGTNPVYNADDAATMLDSFARIVNRMYRGSYAGTFTADRHESRVYKHAFTVPSGPTATGERYLGRPARISAYAIDGTGNVSAAPRWETDWNSRAGLPMVNGAPNDFLCGGSPGTGCAMTVAERDLYGPDRNFRNGVPRQVTVPVNSTDRDGAPGSDVHPVLRWGNMLGNASTQPVVVDAPRDVPAGASGATFGQFQSNAIIANRPRVLYVASNTFVHAIYAGLRNNSPPPAVSAGLDWTPSYSYDDDPATTNAGREMFRYFPRTWMNTVNNYTLNDVVQRPLITGQIVVREMQVDVAPATPVNQFRTVLAVSQGRDGRGLATLDVSNPQGPRILNEWLLPPGNRASVEPMMYQFPAENTAARRPRPMVVVTGGLGGSRTLYAYDIRVGGGLFASVGLPGSGSESYPTEPVCLDAAGRGSVSLCYVLSDIGRLVRVPINQATGLFGAAVDLSGPLGTIGGGRVYHTRPVGFFGADGSVNLVFGSGRASALAQADAANIVYKVVDGFNRGLGGAATTTNVCSVGGAARAGVINLGVGERIISPPTVAKGVVSFTTFRPSTNACDSGTSFLYSMDYQNCTDAFAPTQFVQGRGVNVGTGLPASPTLLRSKGVVLTQTSGQLVSTGRTAGVQTRGGNLSAFRPLFWRPLLNLP